jgi:hypothetical protein
MIKKINLIISFLVTTYALSANDIEFIRSFDLGGQGLKTALLRFDRTTQTMDWIQTKIMLGVCPQEMEIDEWIRLRMHEVLGKELDAEIDAGYLFGFSLAGINKLRPTKPLPHCDMSILFKLPADRTRCIDDGAAHLVASLNTLKLSPFEGPIWNFSLGTGVGWGFTDHTHRVRNLSDFWDFFDIAPWFIKEPRTGLDVWIPCGSHFGFDPLVADNEGIVDEGVFTEFALRWKSYLQECILEYSTSISPSKHWGTPAAIVFTGGHIDIYEDQLVNTLHQFNLTIPLFTGPKNAGLLGAAWNTVLHDFGQTELIQKIVSSNFDAVKSLIDEGVDVNERDALGKSPLSIAIEMGNLELVKLLIEEGAGINIYDYSGQTPLCLAVRSNHIAIVAFLLDRGADVNLCDDWDQMPLFFSEGNKEIESLLLEHGAKLRIDGDKLSDMNEDLLQFILSIPSTGSDSSDKARTSSTDDPL